MPPQIKVANHEWRGIDLDGGDDQLLPSNARTFPRCAARPDLYLSVSIRDGKVCKPGRCPTPQGPTPTPGDPRRNGQKQQEQTKRIDLGDMAIVKQVKDAQRKRFPARRVDENNSFNVP